MKTEASLRQLDEELARRKYWRYVQLVHEGRWTPANYLILICDMVQAHVERTLINSYGRIPRILILSVPPQHGKSMTISETLPSWYLGKWSKRRVLAVSYGVDLAERFGRRNREKVQQFGKDLFGITLNTRMSGVTDWELDNHVGSMRCRGIESGITGQPGDLIVVDDPIKNREQAESQTYRDKIYAEFRDSIWTRLQADACIVLIQTRWHEDDLAGRLLKDVPELCHELNLPCEAEENDPLGRKVGEALAPDLGKDDNWLREFKLMYMNQEGSRSWLALFQGRPTAASGNMIKRSWWKYYDKMPDHFDEMLQSWDCTFKDAKTSDYVVGTVWGRVSSRYYLLDLVRDRMDITVTMASIRNMTAKWPRALTKLIEDKANGSAVIQMLQTSIPGLLPVNPSGGKIARAAAVSPAIESGNVFIPSPELCPWVINYVEEWSAFPNGSNDDQVDSSTQALNHLIYNSWQEVEEKAKPKLPFALQSDFSYESEVQSWY